jgi:hypothetical protein
MIGIAAFLTVFGLLIWYFERRKGRPYIGRTLLTGIPGVYLAGLPALGATKWLYIPGLGLVAACYLLQFAERRRRKTDENTIHPESNRRPHILTGVASRKPRQNPFSAVEDFSSCSQRSHDQLPVGQRPANLSHAIFAQADLHPISVSPLGGTPEAIIRREQLRCHFLGEPRRRVDQGRRIVVPPEGIKVRVRDHDDSMA